MTVGTGMKMGLQPGEVFNEEDAIILPADHVVLLWCSWGIEGIYTNVNKLALQVRKLRTLAAYQTKDIVFSIEIRQINVVLGDDVD